MEGEGTRGGGLGVRGGGAKVFVDMISDSNRMNGACMVS